MNMLPVNVGRIAPRMALAQKPAQTILLPTRLPNHGELFPPEEYPDGFPSTSGSGRELFREGRYDWSGHWKI